MAFQKTETLFQGFNKFTFHSPKIVLIKVDEINKAKKIVELLSLTEIDQNIIKQAQNFLIDIQQKNYPLSSFSYRIKIPEEQVIPFAIMLGLLLSFYPANPLTEGIVLAMNLALLYSIFHSMTEYGYKAKQECTKLFKDGMHPAYVKTVNFFNEKIKNVCAPIAQNPLKQEIIKGLLVPGYSLYASKRLTPPQITVDVSPLLGIKIESLDARALLDLYKKIYDDLLQLTESPKIKVE